MRKFLEWILGLISSREWCFSRECILVIDRYCTREWEWLLWMDARVHSLARMFPLVRMYSLYWPLWKARIIRVSLRSQARISRENARVEGSLDNVRYTESCINTDLPLYIAETSPHWLDHIYMYIFIHVYIYIYIYIILTQVNIDIWSLRFNHWYSIVLIIEIQSFVMIEIWSLISNALDIWSRMETCLNTS